MDIWGRIEAEANMETIAPQECEPIVIEKRSVGLDTVLVLNIFRPLLNFCLRFDYSLIEIAPRQKGLSAMPTELYAVESSRTVAD